MHYYRKTESSLWTVGFYDADQKWQPIKDFNNEDAAATYAMRLNGLSLMTNITAPAPKREKAIEALLQWALLSGYSFISESIEEYAHNRDLTVTIDYRDLLTFKENQQGGE